MTLFPHEEPVEVTGFDKLTIPTRDAGRAVRFYKRVFGFEVASAARTGETSRVVMHGQGCACLMIEERHDANAAPRRLRFAAVDLDGARERLWDLGAALTGGCVEPQFDAGRHCRCLPFRDPDGNEIELVERAALRAVARDARLEGRPQFACLR